MFAPKSKQTVGNAERDVVAYCTKPGHGARLIPKGALTGVHFIRTPHYIQITGVGDLTKLNIPAGDEGGELDPRKPGLNSLLLMRPAHILFCSCIDGADGKGNPVAEYKAVQFDLDSG